MHRLWLIAGLIAVLLPCWPLFQAVSFNNDWVNHLWTVHYYAQFWKAHHGFPEVIHTQSLVGIPNPIFYADVAFRFLGLLASATSPSVAVRVAVFLTYLALLISLHAAYRALGGSRGTSLALSALTLWGIYPLTNLYHRCALPEFFATQGLFIASSFLVLAATRKEKARRYWSLAALLLTVSALVHPITLLLGVPSFLIFFFFMIRSFPEARPSRSTILGNAFLSVTCLLSWLYGVLGFLNKFGTPGNLNFEMSFDSVTARFTPVLWPKFAVGDTPFLEAQANVPLLIWLLFAGHRNWRSVRGALICLGGVSLISLAPFGQWFLLRLGLSSYLGIIQNAYRLTTYINFFAWLITVLALRQSWRLPSKRVTALCVGLAALSLAVKLNHVHKVAHFAEVAFSKNLPPDLPPTFYGLRDYSVLYPATSEMIISPVSLSFRVESEKRFGEVVPQAVVPNGTTLMTSNVYLFPWNKIQAHGGNLETGPGKILREVNLRKAGAAEATERVPVYVQALRAPPVGEVLSYEFSPPRAWRLLRVVSFTTLLLWLLTSFILFSWGRLTYIYGHVA